ncbi:hypothetical protein ACQZ6C_27500 [Rhizobium rhizogenes]|uniref:hypothetical protein n=1 Tax=Rhizobium rhizogenes TaxID=359 RepID=UPI0015718152|nr:hypothetical protein [Rhizobium rhizogenes]NTG51896.1 hypothetical protein [Rhizobium rhizogenes]
MDYFEEAFGGFEPHIDEDAAVKFALSIILMDRRLPELSHLVTDGDQIGGMEGEPGWIIERRDEGLGDVSYYANWPENTRFHAYVDPDVYHLVHPGIFMDTATFHNYVRKGLDAYLKVNPSEAAVVQIIRSLLKSNNEVSSQT